MKRNLWNDYLEGRISRGQLLKAAALAAGMAALPGSAAAEAGPSIPGSPGLSFPFYPQVTSGSYTPESIQDIVSNMLTQHYLHMNAEVLLLTNPSIASNLGLTSPAAVTYFQSSVASHQYQIDFWSTLVPGTTPITTFTIDPRLLADAPTLVKAGEAVDTLRVATDVAAAREFAELGQPTLAKFATQTAGVDGEMRASIRWLGELAGVSSLVPPTNKAFETDLVLYTRDAIAILKGLGLIGGTGVTVPYAGRDKVLAAAGPMAGAIIQRKPNNATSTVAVTGLNSLTSERT